jgi:hypothetical protein
MGCVEFDDVDGSGGGGYCHLAGLTRAVLQECPSCRPSISDRSFDLKVLDC